MRNKHTNKHMWKQRTAMLQHSYQDNTANVKHTSLIYNGINMKRIKTENIYASQKLFTVAVILYT